MATRKKTTKKKNTTSSKQKNGFKKGVYNYFNQAIDWLMMVFEKIFVVIFLIAITFYGLKVSKSSDISFFLTLSEISFTILSLGIVGFTISGNSKYKTGLVKICKSSTMAAVFTLITYMIFPFANKPSILLTIILTITFYAGMTAFFVTVKELYNLVQGYDEKRKV